MASGRVSVRLDVVQLAWLDAIADLHGSTRAGVLRESLRYFIAREADRVQRTRHYAVIATIARAERWDPISDYLAGKELQAP
jgi:metal-responsive CopG/Arc/MetJ family transcriptional regulator